ncbi:hypothetical protein [Methanomassiliicoccus luminyensis]|uniref:hypothetical protein n=1 Tax=Methanomassiliicoccus luminyensis TaxID=1080712 RepID=UPI00036BC928|nr:hypothetical protein [Methanomassiliicoccus luminyensis]
MVVVQHVYYPGAILLEGTPEAFEILRGELNLLSNFRVREFTIYRLTEASYERLRRLL